jgi:excisionase family DNA binding protein
MDMRGRNVTPLRAVPASVDLTIDETAALLHCSYRTVLRLLSARVIPSVKIGRRRMIRSADVDAYLESLRTT